MMSKRRGKNRLQKRQPSPALVTGIAWFTSEEWHKLKQTAADAGNLDDTYDAWRRQAERFMADCQRKGMTLRPVPINIDEWTAWCREKGLGLDSGARSQYVAERVAGG